MRQEFGTLIIENRRAGLTTVSGFSDENHHPAV
jgi:hypothetical protein